MSAAIRARITWSMLLAYLALFVALMPWWGFVVSRLWAWFAVPLGVRPVGIAEACGLSVLLAAFRPPRPITDDDLLADTFKGFLTPALNLGLGYVVHLVAGWS